MTLSRGHLVTSSSQLLRRTPAASPSPVHGSSVPPAQPPLPFAPVVVSRLCLALAAVAVRAPNGIEVYVREAFALSQVCVRGGGGCSLPLDVFRHEQRFAL